MLHTQPQFTASAHERIARSVLLVPALVMHVHVREMRCHLRMADDDDTVVSVSRKTATGVLRHRIIYSNVCCVVVIIELGAAIDWAIFVGLPGNLACIIVLHADLVDRHYCCEMQSTRFAHNASIRANVVAFLRSPIRQEVIFRGASLQPGMGLKATSISARFHRSRVC
jgi:hypothetical protein